MSLPAGMSVKWSQASPGHLLFDHRTPAGQHCAGIITFERHRLVSRKPLTIEPSIQCPKCGLHGFIRAGSWTPA